MRAELNHVISRLEELVDEPLFRAKDGTSLVRVGDVYEAFGFAGLVIGALTVIAACYFLKGGLYTLAGGLGLVALLFADRMLMAVASLLIVERSRGR